MLAELAVLSSLFFQSTPAPDYGKLVPQAKITLAEALDKAGKEVIGGVPVSGYMEDNEGQPRYFVYVAKGKESVEVELDLKAGTVLGKKPHPDDDSKLVAAVKIKISQAIETALKKVPGKAVYADFDMDETGPPEAEVDVFASGKLTKVYINAVSGEVTKTDP